MTPTDTPAATDQILTAGPAAAPPNSEDWKERLAKIIAMMREMSTHADPQAMVASYGRWVRQMMPSDRWISLSRRGLEFPRYRITRSSTWTRSVNPWTEKDKLPIFEGGLLGDLIYADEPRIIDDIAPLLSQDDPAFAYLDGLRSLMAVPHFDRGEGLNMVVTLRKEPGAWERELFPERVWLSSLFGRATQSLVLSQELKRANEDFDRELRVVADIQRSLLPRTLPRIPGVELATYYRTSQWAGGDYYDFFELPDGRWGFLIADVSGHGAPAAVMMAVLHSIAHGHPNRHQPPSTLLQHVNRRLAAQYTTENQVFVTAFYGVYDPSTREFTYACAGHNPPRLRKCSQGRIVPVEDVGGPPLGLFEELEYEESKVGFSPGDILVLYTDGITEAMNAKGEQFTPSRLDAVLERCGMTAPQMIDGIVDGVRAFTGNLDPHDDQTLIVAKFS